MGTALACLMAAIGRQHCLTALSAGFIGNLLDLCPACRTRVMAAIDQAHGEPLDWHADYREAR